MDLDWKKLSPELQKNLTDFAEANNLSMRELAQLSHMMLLRETILAQHKTPIKQNPGDKRWGTRLPNGTQIFKTYRKDLDDALIAYYANSPAVEQQSTQLEMLTQPETPMSSSPSKKADYRTLTTIYPEWLTLRK